jgi:multidrug efflux pump subunit AcrA (membrane-fusion protein)
MFISNEKDYKLSLSTLNQVRFVYRMKKVTSLFFIIFFLTLLFIILSPWQQTSYGLGRVISLNPELRPSPLQAPISGRVKKWHVLEGQNVKAGMPLFELEDNDPQLLERIEQERDNTLQKYMAAKMATETALIDLKRQKDLFKSGLSAPVKVEKAKIEYQKLLSIEAGYASELAKAEVKLSRQLSQVILAPVDGQIYRILYGSGSTFISEGTTVAIFVPNTNNFAVELFVSANDLPLLQENRKVRLQFEGFPAFQMSGWPGIGVGTFGGKIFSIDPSVSEDGKVRILVINDEERSWPKEMFIRQGSRVQGHVLLNIVTLGREIWRQFNGLPADLDIPISENFSSFSPSKNKKMTKEKEKTDEK